MRKNGLISIILAAVMSMTSFTAYAGEPAFYRVKPGDTLYAIGQRFGVSYRSIMVSNSLSSTLIIPGRRLLIPVGARNIHRVAHGETLYRIARRAGIAVHDIRQANGLENNLIRPGMELAIPMAARPGGASVKPVFSSRVPVDREDIRLLARLIYAEARGESLEGQIAVGAVIMNRIASGVFPSGIREVIYQKTKGVYQFTPIQDGQINREPNQTAFYAAERALKGDDPTGKALYFYNPQTSSDHWIRTLSVTRVIGNHVFAK